MHGITETLIITIIIIIIKKLSLSLSLSIKSQQGHKPRREAI